MPQLSSVRYCKVELPKVSDVTRVANLIDAHTYTWNLDIVLLIFTYQSAQKILRLLLLHHGSVDRLWWCLESSGSIRCEVVISFFYVVFSVSKMIGTMVCGTGAKTPLHACRECLYMLLVWMDLNLYWPLNPS
ncbi:hypothetical protein GOBAR_DD02576 [Gossypium barbadense]|nr:hypothetical protein GOBAR_DD02576 [Gossypium barbadense]